MRKIALLLSILSSLLLTSLCGADDCCYSLANQLYIGPEIYHVHRTRNTGSSQNGWIYGVRAGYDHIKRFKFYWGADLLYSRGKLDGETQGGETLKSKFTDLIIEGRLGYTIQQKEGYRLSLTPFLGGGYGIETNNFVPPTEFTFHSKIRYDYVCGGFYSQATPFDCFDVGLNFKIKYLIDAKNKISHDPDFDDATLLVGNRFFYRIELPLTYNFLSQFALSLMPFYEFRHYGKQMCIPFDFFDTRLKIYGVTLKFIYIW